MPLSPFSPSFSARFSPSEERPITFPAMAAVIFLLLVGLFAAIDESANASTDIERRGSLGGAGEEQTEVSKDVSPGGGIVCNAEGNGTVEIKGAICQD